MSGRQTVCCQRESQWLSVGRTPGAERSLGSIPDVHRLPVGILEQDDTLAPTCSLLTWIWMKACANDSIVNRGKEAYVVSVAEGCVEGLLASGEQVPDVRQTLDLKLLRLLLDHLPVEHTRGGGSLTYDL